MSTVTKPDTSPPRRLVLEPRPADLRCALYCLDRLLARRRRMDELRLCEERAPCHWYKSALDRAIVSYLLLAADLGIKRDAEALLEAQGFRVGVA